MIHSSDIPMLLNQLFLVVPQNSWQKKARPRWRKWEGCCFLEGGLEKFGSQAIWR
jgi:hypothetical protein